MKLNDTLIATLPDFAENFTFVEFWSKRKVFLRDMNPTMVFFWNDTQKILFEIISEWVDSIDTPGKSLRCNFDGQFISYGTQKIKLKTDSSNVSSLTKIPVEKGILTGLVALQEFLALCSEDYKKLFIDQSNISAAFKKIDYSSDIIKIPAGREIVLPIVVPGEVSHIQISLKKIEIEGNGSNLATIFIGTNKVGSFRPGSFFYVTSIDNKFIEALPSEIENNGCKAWLVSKVGKLEADLHVQDARDNEYVVENIKSFTVTNDGCTYVRPDGKLDSFVPYIDLSDLQSFKKILFVKSYHGTYYTLSNDGELRESAKPILKNVIGVNTLSDKIIPIRKC